MASKAASAPLAVMLAHIPSLPRPILARLVQQMIDRLDDMDGDADHEDDDPAEEDDHSGDPLDEFGEWPSSDGAPMYEMMPVYGVDQTKGPLNEVEAERARMREVMQEN